MHDRICGGRTRYPFHTLDPIGGQMANTRLPDIALEVRDVSEEIAALREAVEVLESMEVTARVHYLENWEIQRNECQRLAAQVTYYRETSEDWHKTAIERADELSKAKASREYIAAISTRVQADYDAVLAERSNWAYAKVTAERERDMAKQELAKERLNARQSDATGEQILSLLRDGYGVRFEPQDFPKNIPAKITVETQDGGIRHSNTRAFDVRPIENAANLVYTIKRAAYELAASLKPKANFANRIGGGSWTPDFYHTPNT